MATAAAKRHVEEIRSKKFGIGNKEPNPLREDLHQAVTGLSAELYTKDVHFLMELIQNAEDNEYPSGEEPSLEFVLTTRDITRTGAPSTLLVFNNEVGFSRKNMDSICSVGRSTKKGKKQLGFIGEKGIGFKSVFLVSSQPHIFSNGYLVKFSESPDDDCGIGYIVPEWVRETAVVSDVCGIYGANKILPKTIIVLPLKPDKVEGVKTQLAELHPEILLFLCKIKRLSVRVSNNGQEDENVSAIFISSETNRNAIPAHRADSWVVNLSTKEKPEAVEETCQYFIWRQSFQVKPTNKVSTRKDVEDWVVTLAFPFGKRLNRGSPSIGIFAFLPTAMVTNFPFIIQADFILASSRETIVLDNKWNMGILGCVPYAFFYAFRFCVKNGSHLFPVSQAFEFLPAQTSPIPELNVMRESVKLMLQKERIVPCEIFCGREHYNRPGSCIRIKKQFRELLYGIQKEGISLKGMFSLEKVPVHSSLEAERFSKVLDYLGVVSDRESDGWYVQCIHTCHFILQASEGLYVKLLCFIADCWTRTSFSSNFKSARFLKYVNAEGEVKLCTSSSSKIWYAVSDNCHAWLSKWNTQLGCPGGMVFLPSSTQKAIISHERSGNLRYWLSSYASLKCCTVYDYALDLFNIVTSKNETKLAFDCAHFLYHSHSKGFFDQSKLHDLCRRMPIVDGRGCLRKQRLETLVPASRSKWATLFGPFNPMSGQEYVDLGEVYAESYQIAGENTPENELLDFLVRNCKAKDLPLLHPPDKELALTSLTSEQAFLLLDWIRFCSRDSLIPQKFIQSVRDGRWMKTYAGFSSPSQSIFLDSRGKIIFDMMDTVLDGIFVLDEEFYTNRLSSYDHELKYLGVRFGFDDLQILLANRFMSLASSGLSKENTYSLLMFLGISVEKKLLDQKWLDSLKEVKWLRTSQGYSAPKESVFLQSETDVEAILKITNLPVVDELFYGSKLSSFSSELAMLGVLMNMERVYDLTAQHLAFPADVASITANCGLLILRCIRHMGSAAAGFINSVIHQPWLMTNSGVEYSQKCILRDVELDSLFSIVDVPLIDEGFYGCEIRSFMDELKSVGVAIDFEGAFQLITSKLKELSSSHSLTPANVISLLVFVREMIEKRPSQLSEFRSSFIGETWLKTRQGYRAPNESILLSPKWATVSLFVDLPFIDDSFYSIGIYAYGEELKGMGVITDFKEGAVLVARGLKQPINTCLITRDSSISLLECIECLLSRFNDLHEFDDFFDNLIKSKWLKTTFGYKEPEQCILFDPAWDGILHRADVPSIDERSYDIDISVYKDQLRAIGVKVDPDDVCSLLLGILFSKTETSCIARIYSFLSKFLLNQGSPDKSISLKVWIPIPNSAGKGEWVSSHLCVLYDKYKLFGSRLYALEDYYGKELLPMFSSTFGVVKSPCIDDYLKLWNDWVLRSDSRVTAVECFSFFAFVLDNWNPDTLETLKNKLTNLPATTGAGEEICLVSREEVFTPDDLQLKEIFKNEGVPLFTWFPSKSNLSPVFPRRLCEVYSSLGVRKISEAAKCKVGRIVTLKHKPQMFVDSTNGLFEKGLLKIILAFLAGPMMDIPAKERHQAAKSLLDLPVVTAHQAIRVNYQLRLCQGSRTVEASRPKMVLWDRNSHRLILHRSGLEDGKSNIEFVSNFAEEIAAGVLSQGPADAIKNLSKLLQLGFVFDFKEDAVDFLLVKENLELFDEDIEFFKATFGKQTHPRSEQLGPLTPIPSSKKKRSQ